MIASTMTFSAADGTQIFTYRWLPEPSTKVKGVVQIAHGMAEHAGRYGRFAQALTDGGYDVWANDHRGHGRTAGDVTSLGYLADSNGWDKVVGDMHALSCVIRKEQPSVPLILFGYSMGSLLARHYVILHGRELAGVILAGTSGDPGLLGLLGRLVAQREARKKGARTPSPLLDKLSFGAFNKRFRPKRTKFDWLSRDVNEVDGYIADPLCGGVFTAGFFCDLLYGLHFINASANLAKIPKDLPVYLFSGAFDPVGGDTKGVRQVHRALARAGLADLTLKFYDGARHEMLNETNRSEVFADVLAWLDRVAGAALT